MRAIRGWLGVSRVRPTSKRLYAAQASRIPQLLALLRQNPELSEQDAKNELRWMNQALDHEPSLLDERSRDATIMDMVTRRSRCEPLQYILGSEDFGPLTIRTRAPVLIPRPETAYITDLLADAIRTQTANARRPLRVLDLCSGSGCIALLLKHRLGTSIDISGADISPHALSLARENARALDLEVEFKHVDIWRDADLRTLGEFDLLVSNPPYIPRAEWDQLDRGVKEYEDPGALVGNPEDLPGAGTGAQPEYSIRGHPDGRGLAFYRRIAKILPALLSTQAVFRTAGWAGIPRVAVEVGHDQADEVSHIFGSGTVGAISKTEAWLDQYDVPRMVVGW